MRGVIRAIWLVEERDSDGIAWWPRTNQAFLDRKFALDEVSRLVLRGWRRRDLRAGKYVLARNFPRFQHATHSKGKGE